MISLENIILHELIGLKTEIKESTNSQIVGINGLIVDETKQMFTIDSKHGVKMISKKDNTWEFSYNNQKITLSGILLSKRPHERLELKT
jgi:ribonuclease P protein subunit POP4